MGMAPLKTKREDNATRISSDWTRDDEPSQTADSVKDSDPSDLYTRSSGLFSRFPS